MFEAKKPTEEEMEAYYLKRRREEDPMDDFMKQENKVFVKVLFYCIYKCIIMYQEK